MCHHDFESSLSKVSGLNRWCPYCSNHKLCDKDCNHCYQNSFASYVGKTSKDKLKVECWHEDNKLEPRQVFKSCNKKFKFKCDVCHHNFESSLNSVLGKNTWCPYCSKAPKNLCNQECNHCYQNSFASYVGKTSKDKLKVECWHTDNELTSRQVFKSCGKKFKFKCNVCNHDFDSSLDQVSGRDSWCPYCSNQKLCNQECNHCYQNSFASYLGKTSKDKLKVECWHTDNELTSRQVFKSCGKKFKFKCNVCNHDFDSSLDQVSGRDSWCPYCSKAPKNLCNQECNHCYNNSFSSYIGKTSKDKLKIECWHTYNKLSPRQVFKSCGKKFKFKCDVCNHDFESRVAGVSGRDIWCPYCSKPPQKLCNQECNHCYNNSFSSYIGKTSKDKLKVECWHTDNKLTPRQVFKSCGKKFKFKCDVCNHDFDSTLNSISGLNTWCPYCTNKTELKLFNWLKKLPNVIVKREFKPKWCSTEYTILDKNKIKNKRYQYRYDFLITFNNKKQLIIELDGPQHFEQVSNWKSPLHQQIRDKYKEFKAKKHGIKIIRCIQEDVLMERNNWDKKLNNKLKKYIKR